MIRITEYEFFLLMIDNINDIEEHENVFNFINGTTTYSLRSIFESLDSNKFLPRYTETGKHIITRRFVPQHIQKEKIEKANQTPSNETDATAEPPTAESIVLKPRKLTHYRELMRNSIYSPNSTDKHNHDKEWALYINNDVKHYLLIRWTTNNGGGLVFSYYNSLLREPEHGKHFIEVRVNEEYYNKVMSS